MEHFITELRIGELLHLSDIRIELNPEKRTNLLLTGKNGSGKTTVLRALARHLCENGRAGGQTRRIQSYLAYLNKYGDGLKIIFNEEKEIHRLCKEGEFLTAFYRADRKTAISRQKGPEEVVLEKGYSVYFGPGDVLLKYLVHLKTQQAYARNEGYMETVQLLDQWFERFAGALRVLLDDETLQLKYDYKKYDFQIIEEGRKPFGFDQLSDGYSAAIQIVADLILRMEQNWLKEGILSSYDVEGVVLIDELETHLHISLQRKILPFLTEFFPRIFAGVQMARIASASYSGISATMY